MSTTLLGQTYEMYEELRSRGLTQRQMAEGAGVSYWWFIKWAQKSIERPSVQKIETLRDYFSRELDAAA